MAHRLSRGVRSLLRLEGLAVLAGAVSLYAGREASWLLFALLFLVPDVSMLGYLKDPEVGAAAYNAFHTYLGPVVLGAVAWWLGHDLAVQVSLVWIGHIGIDRLLGFGLKLPTGFADTHLGVATVDG